jgi:deoxycytidylate deaminase
MITALQTCSDMCDHGLTSSRPARARHGAVILGKGGRVLAKGYNHYRTRHTSFKYGSPCSFHAEMHAVYNYMREMKHIKGTNPS